MEETMRHVRSRPSSLTRRAVLLTAAATAAAAFSAQQVPHLRALPSAVGREGTKNNTLVDNPQADEPQVIDPGPSLESVQALPPQQVPLSRQDAIARFAGRSPRYWGLEAPGVVTRLPQGSPGVAVTVDFCGGSGGNGFDHALLAVLRDRRIPAALFLNYRWIAANSAIARQLAADPVFELANHGTSHRPLSITGRSAYGIPGTRDVGEAYDEVMTNDAALMQLTGTRARFFRPGTAYLTMPPRTSWAPWG